MLDHFKTYPGHLLLYITGAFDLVSQLPAAGVLAPYAPYITAAGVIAGSLHHAYQTGVASKVAAVAASAPAKLMLAMFVLSALTACASVQSFLGSPSGEVVTVAAVDVAVTTAEQRGVKAAQINAIAKAVLAADAGATTTLAQITAVASAELSTAGVPAGDVAAYQILAAAFDAYLVAKYGSNSTVVNVQVDVATFAGAVIAATGG